MGMRGSYKFAFEQVDATAPGIGNPKETQMRCLDCGHEEVISERAMLAAMRPEYALRAAAEKHRAECPEEPKADASYECPKCGNDCAGECDTTNHDRGRY
jgi:transcription elongation factor Elf1